jgi:hypothetical protein
MAQRSDRRVLDTDAQALQVPAILAVDDQVVDDPLDVIAGADDGQDLR